jgi:AcrR family transcriptional regulator
MNTKARSWLRAQGDWTALARRLGVSRASLYNWYRSESDPRYKSPAPGNAKVLVDLSDGELELSDIYPALFGGYRKEPTHD